MTPEVQESTVLTELVITRLSVHFNEGNRKARILGSSVEYKTDAKPSNDKLDFLFETQDAFDWFRTNIKEGCTVRFDREFPFTFYFDDYYEVTGFLTSDGNLLEVPEAVKDNIYVALYHAYMNI
jgi:hypothetical protein